LNGEGEVTSIEGANLKSWSLRWEKTQRFVDLQLSEGVAELKTEIKLRSKKLSLPTTIELGHLTPGASVGFDSIVNINFATGVKGNVTTADGFVPLESGDPTTGNNKSTRFQTSTGGLIKLEIRRDGTSPAPVELLNSTLKGERPSNDKSVRFQLRSTAQVREANAEVVILSGNAAVSEIPNDANYRLRLSTDGARSVYKLVFPKAGTFPIALDFVATLMTSDANGQGVDFTIAASAIVPLTISGLDKELVFHRDQESVVPQRRDDKWLGFLPATGRAKLHWKSIRKTGEGKLFFTTTGRVEAKIGTGLLRQDHKIDYQVLQGELKSLSILLRGPGEILDVQGTNMVAWKVSGSGENRQLDITLSQPITLSSQFHIRSQTPLAAFPIRVEGLRLNPIGAIRHSGYLRLTNFGSVRVEPAGLVGLTQLAPEQFPGDPIEARQVYVYRFPAADHAFTVAADRIQPEVNISELVLYQLAEADRVIRSDVELDIREAPIREWEFRVPSDYSVVSVTGANVVDYIAATEITEGRRSLKVIFGQDVIGRQLVSLHLEKSEVGARRYWNCRCARLSHCRWRNEFVSRKAPFIFSKADP
jgi:hypothetical protein